MNYVCTRKGLSVAGWFVILLAMVTVSAVRLPAQELPYFVTYSQDMEEPGNLDIENFNAVGNPKGGNAFIGSDVEFEYGATAWWTTEFYLDGQATTADSTM